MSDSFEKEYIIIWNNLWLCLMIAVRAGELNFEIILFAVSVLITVGQKYNSLKFFIFAK